MRPDAATAEVRRRLSAAPEKVFAAFSEASLVSQWLTPSPEIPMRVLHFDFRAGGGYRFAYDVPAARTVCINGIYRAIEPPSTIVFSWNIEPPDEHAGIESEVTVTIRPAGRGTDLVIRHEQLTMPGAMSRHEEGWRGALERLTALIEGSDHP